ncbi:MAG: hypothetical protein ACNS62_13010 [Candidatus Cyclobacteriaceae bacterium M3_2C_046]
MLKKKNYIWLIVVWVNLLMACQSNETSVTNEARFTDKSVAEIVRKANILYDSAAFQTGHSHVPPYIANGILGGSFDHMGFQSRPNKGIPEGRTVLGYIDQFYMAENTRQAQLPLAIIQAEFADGSSVLNMMETTGYNQELDIYQGTLTTRYDLYGPTEITALAHQTQPNLFLMKILRKPEYADKELVIKINAETSSSQNADIKWKAEPVKLDLQVQGNQARITSSTNMTTTNWSVISNNEIIQSGNEIHIRLKNEENIIKILIERPDLNNSEVVDQTFDQLLATHTRRWEEDWEKSWIDFPEDRAHNIWNRANYYNLSNFPLVPEKALIPTGMNTNIWGFTFPQDVYYVAENLTRTRHFERYRKAMKYWLDILPEVKKYSVRIMDVAGGFYPWTPPFDQWDQFEKHGAVSNDSYEIHNPAYVSAMVWHFYQRTGDQAFLQEYFPIMEEVWRFYTNVIHPNQEGTFDVNHHKAAGQDEASRLESSKNLLCASYSAEYSARNYLKAAELVDNPEPELVQQAETILEAGLERDKLLKSTGYYRTYEGDDRPPNSQKHPVQLNAITFCPMGDLVPEGGPAQTAWQNRYELTAQAKKPVSHGWTYGAFALASSRMGSEEAFARDLSAIQYFAGADPRWIQFYEFTFWERYTLNLSYYFPTQGLYQQAFTDAVVQDWRGYIDLFATLLPEWKTQGLSFHGIVVDGGAEISGNWKDDHFKVSIKPGFTENIELQVSQQADHIHASGHKEGPDHFEGNQRVTLTFDGDTPIVLEN